MKPATILAPALLFCFACSPQVEVPSTSPFDVERVAQQFLDHAHSFNYEGMRAVATSDFEILIFGRRMDIDEFEEMLREIEASRDGNPIDSYELGDLNTRIIGNVAYTSWMSEHWLESAVFIRNSDRWLIDRASAIPIEEPSQ